MKKIFLLTVLCLFLFTSCANRGNSAPSESTAGNRGESETRTPPVSQAAGKPLPDYVCSGTYYKLEVAPTVYDTEAILTYLIPGFDKSRVQKEDTVEGEKSFIEIDGVKHTWVLGGRNMSYFNDSALGRTLTTRDKALAYGDDFVKQMGWEVAENPNIRRETDGCHTIRYLFQYKGVPILGEDGIGLKNQNDGDDFAYGEYIEIGVGENGIRRVYLNHLYDLAAVREEYRAEELISGEQLEGIINLAFHSFYQELYNDHVKRGCRMEEIELVYMPWKENRKWVFLPAFSVRCVELEDGKEKAVKAYQKPVLVDAVSGYVYRK